MKDIAAFLDGMTRPAQLVEALEDGVVRCLACGHRCVIKPGKRGVCQVRFNDGESLRAPWGYLAALQADPIEKKPFSHFLPGAIALTFGMLGCDFKCGYCQNWLTSQALRNPASDLAVNLVRQITPAEIVQTARRVGAQVLVSSYNEPLITAEWAVAVFRKAKESGLKCAFVSNGNATPQALAYLRPYLDGYKVDLKSMRQETYRQLGGALKHVLETIEQAHALGLWVEVVTLVVPGLNDSNEELWQAARFLAAVSPDIPWHVSAFHPDYKMSDRDFTSSESLVRAAEIGREAGLHYVYAGNLPGRVGEYEDTFCAGCGRALIRRRHYELRQYHLDSAGRCPACGLALPGIWLDEPPALKMD
ncbi:MAG: AmmeMemoRadiSam system radical SAM enzyme [Anaerolineales bacterium]|nr:AmmeMemoRadiSam system radical SAM enzyme [Anaerolineales bacterium]